MPWRGRAGVVVDEQDVHVADELAAAAHEALHASRRTARARRPRRGCRRRCASACGSRACSCSASGRSPVAEHEAVVAVAHQLAIGRQVRQDRHAAVRHRLEHRDRDRVARRQAQVPARPGVPARLCGGVEAAGLNLPPRRRRDARPSARTCCRQAVGAASRRWPPPAAPRAARRPPREHVQHALGRVDRLQARGWRRTARSSLRPRRRRQGFQAERKDHHLARAELAHALGHVLRVARGQRCRRAARAREPTHRWRQRSGVTRMSLPQAEPTMRPRNRHRRLRQPGQRAVRGEVVGVQPVGVDGRSQRRAAAARLSSATLPPAATGRRVQRQAPLRRQHGVEGRHEAAARRRPQLDAGRRSQRARPLQQVRDSRRRRSVRCRTTRQAPRRSASAFAPAQAS